MRKFFYYVCTVFLMSLFACGDNAAKSVDLSYSGVITHGDKPSSIYLITLTRAGDVDVKFSIGAEGKTREFPVKNVRKQDLKISFTTVILDNEKASVIELEKELGPETVPAKVRFPNDTFQELLLLRNR